MNEQELAIILSAHKLWIDDGIGSKADLCEADLYGADLHGADLCRADLREADLYGADLHGADLSIADLYGANLSGANLRGADLRRADLRGADLREADLHEADLRGADLRGANLHAAKLDSPVYQFQVGRHNAVCTKEYVQIGCERHSWDHWLANYEEHGSDAGYTDNQIEAYINVIKLFRRLL